MYVLYILVYIHILYMYISYIETGQKIRPSCVQCQWKANMNSNHSMFFFLIVVVVHLTGCGSIPTILLFYVVFLPLPFASAVSSLHL